MHRTLYLAGFGYLAVCAALVIRHRTPARPQPVAIPTSPTFDGPPNQWFTAMKPYCNAVEVAIMQRRDPAPATLDGAGVSAARYALGGELGLAPAPVDRLPAAQRA